MKYRLRISATLIPLTSDNSAVPNKSIVEIERVITLSKAEEVADVITQIDNVGQKYDHE